MSKTENEKPKALFRRYMTHTYRRAAEIRQRKKDFRKKKKKKQR